MLRIIERDVEYDILLYSAWSSFMSHCLALSKGRLKWRRQFEKGNLGTEDSAWGGVIHQSSKSFNLEAGNSLKSLAEAIFLVFRPLVEVIQGSW
jgi:hypothetical protein